MSLLQFTMLLISAVRNAIVICNKYNFKILLNKKVKPSGK